MPATIAFTDPVPSVTNQYHFIIHHLVMHSILGLVNTRSLLLIFEILELTTYLDQNHKDAEQGQFILALNKVKCNFVCKFSTNSIVKVHFPLKM